MLATFLPAVFRYIASAAQLLAISVRCQQNAIAYDAHWRFLITEYHIMLYIYAALLKSDAQMLQRTSHFTAVGRSRRTKKCFYL